MFRELLDRFLAKHPRTEKPIREFLDKGIDAKLDGATNQDPDLVRVFQEIDRNPSRLTMALPKAVDYCRKKARELAAKAAEHEKKATEIEDTADPAGSEIMRETLTDEIEDHEIDRDRVFRQSRFYRTLGRTYNDLYRLLETTAPVGMLPSLEVRDELRDFVAEQEAEIDEHERADESEKRRNAIKQRLLAKERKRAAGKERPSVQLGSESEADASDG